MHHIRVFHLGPLETNCYIIHNKNRALVVDPGGNPEVVVQYLQENGLSLERIVCSHLHFDHTYGIAALVRATGAPVYASEQDRYMLASELGRGGTWGLPEVDPYEYTELAPGEMTALGTQWQVLATPGHTPGGLSFYCPDVQAVFAGDTLFERSVGRTDFPGGNLDTLMHSIHTQLFTLPAETVVYPGHGDPTSVHEERLNNPFTGEFTFG